MTSVSADAASARALIDANDYMTIASADAAGGPWATPVWFAHDQYVELLWVSRPDARHSTNIATRAEVGIVIFDSTVPAGTGKAVYVEGVARQVGDEERSRLLTVFSTRSTDRGGEAWTTAMVTGDAPHRFYAARAETHYVLDDHDRRVSVAIGG